MERKEWRVRKSILSPVACTHRSMYTTLLLASYKHSSRHLLSLTFKAQPTAQIERDGIFRIAIKQFDGDSYLDTFLGNALRLAGTTRNFHMNHFCRLRQVGFIGLNSVVEYDKSFLFETHIDLSVVLSPDAGFALIDISIGIAEMRRGNYKRRKGGAPRVMEKETLQ